MNSCTPSYSQTPFVLSDLLETLMAGFAFGTPPLLSQVTQPVLLTNSNRAKLKCFDSRPMPCASQFWTTFGFAVFVQRQHKARHHLFSEPKCTGAQYSQKMLFILRKNPKQTSSGALVLHLIFLHPIKTLFSAKLDIKPVPESLVVACSCTSRRADRPMHKDDQLTAFRGVSDSVQHVSFAYVS